MKTEKQCLEKMEKAVDALVETANSIEDGRKATEDEQATVITWLVNVSMLAWVLDQENELRPMLAGIKLAGISEKLKAL